MSPDKSPFDILGVSASAELEVIRAAYRALARKYRPDANPDAPPRELNRRLAELNWARDELERDLEGWRRRVTGPPASETAPTRQRPPPPPSPPAAPTTRQPPPRPGPRQAPARPTPGAAPTTPAPARPAPPAPAPTDIAAFPITLEGILWAALLALAFALRLASLDHLPLTVGESARAFDAWLVSEGSVPSGWPGDLTAALTAHLFRIFGSGETLARLLPALSGSALIASLWFAGRYTGRGVALLAALFLAFSPLAVHSSRSAFGFAAGALLSMVMVLSLLSYLQERRPAQAAVLAGAFGLSLGSDPIAVSTALALVVFLALEGAWRPGGAVAQAASALRAAREQWQPAAITLAASLLLGFLHFGTDIDRLSLPGLQQWLDMFTLPRDGLPWHYQLDVLVGYEWPLLLPGLAAYVLLLVRWFGAGQTPSVAHRLLLVWATAGLLVAVFATRRESGQLLALLLPFALLAAGLLEEAVSRTDWSPLRRWWPAVALALAFTAYGLYQLTRWASEGGHISTAEQVYLVMALLAAATIVTGAFFHLGRNGLAIALPLAAALALPFLIHSSLSLGLGEGTEFAAGPRITPQVEALRASVLQAAAQTNQPVAVDDSLRDELGWSLRSSPIAFGDPPPAAAAVTPAAEAPPPGLAPLSGPWRLAEGWAPEDFDRRLTWRWFVFRQAYGNLSNIDVQVLVPAQ